MVATREKRKKLIFLCHTPFPSATNVVYATYMSNTYHILTPRGHYDPYLLIYFTFQLKTSKKSRLINTLFVDREWYISFSPVCSIVTGIFPHLFLEHVRLWMVCFPIFFSSMFEKPFDFKVCNNMSNKCMDLVVWGSHLNIHIAC